MNITHRNKSLRILAKSLFREMTSQGYSEQQIVSLATELIGEVRIAIGINLTSKEHTTSLHIFMNLLLIAVN